MMKRLLTVLALAALAAGPIGAHASPIACANPCTVLASIEGYVAPVVDVTSGSAVQWQGLDGDVAHPTAEATSSDTDAPCFLFPASNIRSPVPINFTITNGTLTATEPFINSQYPSGTNTCLTARALPDGSFTLQFHCLLHPWMYGLIRVEP